MDVWPELYIVRLGTSNIFSSLRTIFLFVFVLFNSCCFHAQAFGKTIVHEFHNYGFHAEWCCTFFYRKRDYYRICSRCACRKLTIIILAVRCLSILFEPNALYHPLIHSTRQLSSNSTTSTHIFIPISVHSCHFYQTSHTHLLRYICFSSLNTLHISSWAHPHTTLLGQLLSHTTLICFKTYPILLSTSFSAPHIIVQD